MRGLPDRSDPDVARIEQAARHRLGDARFAEAAREGTQTSWSQLAAVTLADLNVARARRYPATAPWWRRRVEVSLPRVE